MNERDIEREKALIEQADREFFDEEFGRLTSGLVSNDIEDNIVTSDTPVTPMTHEHLTRMVKLEAAKHSSRAGAQHGVWVAYGDGRTRQFGRPGMTIMEAYETRRRIFNKLLAMKKRGAIIAATEVGISGGPAMWR